MLSQPAPSQTDSAEALPGPEIRQQLLSRASLTLGEARALVELLDQTEPPAWGVRGEGSNRSVFGFQPLPQHNAAAQP